MKTWLHQCRHCGKPIYFFYEGWHHEHKREDPWPASCSDDPVDRHFEQAEPIENEAIKAWFCNSTLLPRCSAEDRDPMGLGSHDSCRWMYLIPIVMEVAA